MKKGDVFITLDDTTQVITPDNHIITLPPNKLLTYVENDIHDQVWLNVDGMDCIWTSGSGRTRQLPYPIEKPSTLEEYRELISKIVKNMYETFGTEVEIEANQYRVKFHLG